MSSQRDKVLIIGGSSYIGGYLSSRLHAHSRVYATFFSHIERVLSGDAVQLDVRDAASVAQVIRTIQPDIIYLLSYSLSDLDGTIIKGASHVMRAADSIAQRVILLSTDVVFGGEKRRYFEGDAPDYINEYGHAKYEAEKIVLDNRGHVVRTSLVYGFEPMDVRTSQLLGELRKGSTSVAYFSDEFRCPIFIEDLCSMLAELPKPDCPGILHMTGPECMSRLDFARKIASAYNHAPGNVRSALLKDSGLNRPQHLCLDSTLVQEVLGCRIRPVDEVLSQYVTDGHAHMS